MNVVTLPGFVVGAAAVFVGIIAAAWVWAINGRMWFLDPEYPMWVAKTQMIRNCAHGETTILGDSKAVAGLMPDLMGNGVVNLALGGASPIESVYIVESTLKCRSHPKHVIISFSPHIFVRPAYYWTRTAPFSFLTLQKMEEVKFLSKYLNDTTIYSPSAFHHNGLLANYYWHFGLPSFYFPAMWNAGFVKRKERNESVLEAVLRARGHHLFGMAARTDWPSGDTTRLLKFKASPLLDYYFHRLISTLNDNNIPAYFVGMPINEATFRLMRPELAKEFSTYLEHFVNRYPNFRIAGEVFPVLPADNFGDPDHLNQEGATMWSLRVANRLAKAIEDDVKPSTPR